MTLKSKFFNKILHLKVSGNLKIQFAGTGELFKQKQLKKCKEKKLETKQKAFYSNGFDCVFIT